MIGGQNSLDQPLRNDLTTYDSIQKIATGQRDDFTTGYLLDYNHFKNYYKMIALDLSKQQALDVDSKAIQHISFSGNLVRTAGARMILIIKEAKETFRFFTSHCKSILISFFA